MENILPAGRRRRRVNGVVAAVVALGTAVLLTRSDAGPAWFALVFVLVLLASLMFLQARDDT